MLNRNQSNFGEFVMISNAPSPLDPYKANDENVPTAEDLSLIAQDSKRALASLRPQWRVDLNGSSYIRKKRRQPLLE